jgi:hypothetical protein
MPFHIETRIMKAYRIGGAEVQPGEIITDFRGDQAVFYAATRVTEPSQDGMIQVSDPFGPEYYARGFGLTVSYADAVSYAAPTAERISYLESRDCHGDHTGQDGCEHVNECPACYGEASEELARLRATATQAQAATAAPVGRLASWLAEAERVVELGPDGPDTAGLLATLESLAAAVRADLEPDPGREAELAAEAAEAARTMAPPVPGVTENLGYVMFTVIDGTPGGNGQLRSWYVAGEREDGACAVWTACQREDGTLSYEGGSYVTCADPAEPRKRASLIAAKRAGVLDTLTAYVTRDEALRARFDTSYDAAFAELNGIAGLARVKVRDALLEAAAFGRAGISGSGGRTWTACYDRVRCAFAVRQDS